MDPTRLRPSLRRQLLGPLAVIGAFVSAAVLLAARHEMRAQLESQLLGQARLVADAARRIAQTNGTRDELPRFTDRKSDFLWEGFNHVFAFGPSQSRWFVLGY